MQSNTRDIDKKHMIYNLMNKEISEIILPHRIRDEGCIHMK